MQLPITIGLHRSRFLDAALVVTALAAGATILAWPQPSFLLLAVLLFIATLGLVAWKQLRLPFSAIRIARGGQIFVLRAGVSEFLAVEPLSGAIAHHWLTIVRLKAEDGQKYWLIATVDTLKTEDFRRLRVFLRWRAKFSGQVDDA